MPSPLTVGRYHSLVVATASLPNELRPTAWTEDGVLMAFEHTQLPVFGVQFHPESILTNCGYELLSNFLELAGLAKRGRPGTMEIMELCQPAAPSTCSGSARDLLKATDKMNPTAKNAKDAKEIHCHFLPYLADLAFLAV